MGRWVMVGVVCAMGAAGCGAKSGLSVRPADEVSTEPDAPDARPRPLPRHDAGIDEDAGSPDDPDAHTPILDGAIDSGRPLEPVVQVTAGWRHSCALFADGRAACWGNGESGRLGDGSGSSTREPIWVRGLGDAIRISAGLGHTCALRRGGHVVCWGDNAIGQVGDGTRETRYLPTPVLGIEDATAISAGGTHNCAILESGRIVCWGHDGFGQLGGGDRVGPDMRMVLGLNTAIDVAAGHQHTCAVVESGRVLCWGRVGESYTLDVPTEMDSGATDVASGRFQWCAVRGGVVRCRPEIADAVSVNVGDGFGCAVQASGTARCWGANDFGQLGDGNAPFGRGLSAPVIGLDDAILVSGSYEHTCATRRSGPPVCWGRNDHHQVSPALTMGEDVPVPVDFGALSGRPDAGTR